MITIKYLKQLKPRTIFAKGRIEDSPGGCNIAGTETIIKWVAVRGGMHDWAIYTDNPFMPLGTFDEVSTNGEKLHNETFIKKLVACDDASFDLYRH